jgi:integrase
VPDDRHDHIHRRRHRPAGVHRVRPYPLAALFAVRRADIETFARELEARGRARATVTRRLCAIAGFYKYAVEEELLEHPRPHVRRPRLDYESHATALGRNELGAILVTAGLSPPAEHALISLLALNGLRVSEATGADIEQLGLERGHRTPVITRTPSTPGAAARRAGGRFPRRPAHHHALRPGTHQPRQARHLHCRCLYPRSSTITPLQDTRKE